MDNKKIVMVGEQKRYMSLVTAFLSMFRRDTFGSPVLTYLEVNPPILIGLRDVKEVSNEAR